MAGTTGRGIPGPLAAALGSLATAAGRAVSRRGGVPRRGTWRVPGLAREVRIRFDGFGVPHVEAATDADAFLALGLCHGLDRFFQMDLARRALAGRLAEAVGEHPLGAHAIPPFGGRATTADADRLVRALGLLPAARRALAAGGPEGRSLLDAYVAGVNAARRALRGRPPLEHRLLRLPLAPWRAIDSMLLAKGMALGLSFKWRTAPVLGAVAARLRDRPDHLAAILPPAPAPGDPALARLVRHAVDGTLAWLPWAIPPAGSNAFVVGGRRSQSGLPVLASDPHLELTLPSVWYLASLRGDRYAAVGATLPGLPGVVIGRTPTVAWGLTNGMIDDGDLWEEETDLGGTRYRVDGRWRAMEVTTAEVRRRGAAPAIVRLRSTHRGPVVSDAFPGYAGPPLSLRLTLHDPGRDLEAFLGLGRARTVGEALAAMDGHGSPAQNLLVADTQGRAAYRLIGRVPRRAPHPVHPGLPRDGRDGATDWTGDVPSGDLPAFDVPADGAAVSANEPQADGGLPLYLSHLYEPPYRAQRIRERLAGRADLTIDDLASIQGDATNLAARWFRDLVLRPHVDAVWRLRPTVVPALQRLLAWDGAEDVDAVGPALWHLTYHHLLRRTFGAALGEDLLGPWLGLVNLMDAPLRRAFEDPASPWAPPAARPALLRRALEDAEADLAARGLTAASPWGALHALTLRSPLAALPVIGPAFTQGPWPLPGGPFAPCAGQYVHSRPARAVVGASYRQVVDLGDPERRSRMVTYAGQSGAIGSPHADDLTATWLAGGGIPMRLETAPDEGTTLVLRPG